MAGWPPLTDVDGVGVLCDLCLDWLEEPTPILEEPKTEPEPTDHKPKTDSEPKPDEDGWILCEPKKPKTEPEPTETKPEPTEGC